MNKLIEILDGIRPEFAFKDEVDYIKNGMLDSFDMIILITELEKVYAITIPGREIIEENFENMDAIKRLIEKSGGTV